MSLTKLQEMKLRALPGFDDVHARALCSEPLPYAEAQKIVQKAGIKTWREFYAWKRPEGLPSSPDKVYVGKGWTNWPEFFGTDYVSYEKAQKIVKKAGIKTQKEFKAWKRPKGLPSHPDETYAGKGWKSWQEFLGIGVPFVAMPYRESQKIVQKAGIQTNREFNAWKPKPEGVPSHPNTTYEGKGWKSWFEFLGTGTPFVALPYKEAQKLVQQAKLKSAREFYAWKPKPDGVPSCPDTTYEGKGWKSWFEFLGTGTPFVALPYAEVQKIVQKAGIKTQTEFYAWKRPEGVPSNPHRTYKGKGWKSWPEFLGTVV